MCKKYFVPIDPHINLLKSHTLLKRFLLLLSDLYHHKKVEIKIRTTYIILYGSRAPNHLYLSAVKTLNPQSSCVF